MRTLVVVAAGLMAALAATPSAAQESTGVGGDRGALIDPDGGSLDSRGTMDPDGAMLNSRGTMDPDGAMLNSRGTMDPDGRDAVGLDALEDWLRRALLGSSDD